MEEKVRRFRIRLNEQRGHSDKKISITVKENSGRESDWRTVKTIDTVAVHTDIHTMPHSSHKWLESVDRFAERIINVEKKRDKTIATHQHLENSIVVAIINDGVDISEKCLRSRILSGHSFDTGIKGDYWYTTSRHGTIMAQMVVRVCPAVKIIVLKIQTFPDDSQLRINPKSAAEVSHNLYLITGTCINLKIGY